MEIMTCAQSDPKAALRLWDKVLMSGKRIQGIAADDSHRKQFIGKFYMVVMDNGDWYGTAGMRLKIRRDDKQITVDRAVKWIADGKHVGYGKAFTFDAEKYARFEVWADDELRAFSNPYWSK